MPQSPHSDASIGDRLRRLRNQRGLTREQLAERAAVSVDLIKKLEQGRRESARLTTLTALARALDVARSDLLGSRPRLNGDGDRLILDLRDAVLTPDVLVGLEPEHDGGEATTADALREHVAAGWRDYWSGSFRSLAQDLPPLLREARVAHRDLGPPATGPLAQAYQLVACLLVHLGREDLAAVAAERGVSTAAAGDDELLWATLHGTYCWALLGQARYDEAEQHAMRIAGRIEPRFSVAAPEHLTVWGGLVLWALAAAVEGGHGSAVEGHIALARVGAARLDADRHDYQVNFGPTQVAMQNTYANAALGEPGKAFAAAGGVRRADLFPISYGRHLLDLSQAHVDAGQLEPAAQRLKEAMDLSPVWFRHQALAHSLAGDLADRQARTTPLVRELVGALDPPH